MGFFSGESFHSTIHYNPWSLPSFQPAGFKSSLTSIFTSTNQLIYPSVFTASLPVLFILGAYLFFIHPARARQQKSHLPKYDTLSPSSVKHMPSKNDLRQLDHNIDVAIVGSGIGALSNAASLALKGYKVAVFEQNMTVGGCTHTFEKEGFEFDVGVHYVGGFSSTIRRMYDEITDGMLKWQKLDRVYDVIYIGETGERIEMTDDHELNRWTLTRCFKIDEAVWKKFDKACFWAKFWAFVVFQLKLWHPAVLSLVWPFVYLPYKKYALKNTTDVLKGCGLSEDAVGALTYHWGDHGVPPHRCPFFLTALLDTHYKGGGYFPKGGSRSIAKCLVSAIERRGGHVYASSPVQEIITRKKFFGGYKAVGLTVRGVDIHVRKCIVSDAGFLNTFGIHGDFEAADFTPPLVTKAGFKQRALMHDSKRFVESGKMDAVTPCISDVSLFIGLNRSDVDLQLPAQNVWHLRTWDHERNWKDMMNHTCPEDSTAEKTPFLFISNESAKDPDFGTKHPNKATSEVFAVCKYDLFKKWENTTHEMRETDPEYIALKKKLTENLLNAFYLHFPRAKGHVVFTSFGTPVTMNKFLGRKHGEVYALDHDVARFDGWKVQRALHPQTYVDGLFLTGEDAFLVSVTAGMISGHITAARCTWENFFGIIPLLFKGLPQLFFG